MFTGLIETTGTLLALNPSGGATRIIIAAPHLSGRWRIGDSIAVNGVCLTAVDMEADDEPHPGRFAADLAEETVQRTTLTRLQPGSIMNLELPTPAGSPMGGHVVQGHVDGTGMLVSVKPVHSSDLDYTDWRMTVELPDHLAHQVIPQGSITIDGISLTVAKVEGTRIEIAVIPHTYKATNLHSLAGGAPVNVEIDALAKYAARQYVATTNAAVEAPHGAAWLTEAYLLANGY